MSIMIDLPPAIEREAQGYVILDGMSMEQFVLMCMENEFARRRERRHTRSPRAMEALAEWKRLVDQSRGRLMEPYKFNRADAYPKGEYETEDLNDGQMYGSVKAVNPFK